MLYKTMIHELLQQRPEMHDQLRNQRMLLPTLNAYASQLRDSHLAWERYLSLARPGRSQSQNATEALELALQDMQSRLPYALPLNDNEPLSLDAAMAFLRGHTPPE